MAAGIFEARALAYAMEIVTRLTVLRFLCMCVGVAAAVCVRAQLLLL